MFLHYDPCRTISMPQAPPHKPKEALGPHRCHRTQRRIKLVLTWFWSKAKDWSDKLVWFTGVGILFVEEEDPSGFVRVTVKALIEGGSAERTGLICCAFTAGTEWWTGMVKAGDMVVRVGNVDVFSFELIRSIDLWLAYSGHWQTPIHSPNHDPWSNWLILQIRIFTRRSSFEFKCCTGATMISYEFSWQSDSRKKAPTSTLNCFGNRPRMRNGGWLGLVQTMAQRGVDLIATLRAFSLLAAQFHLPAWTIPSTPNPTRSRKQLKPPRWLF